MWFLLFLICYLVFCVPECGLIWWMFNVNLRRMCILLLWVNKNHVMGGAVRFNYILTAARSVSDRGMSRVSTCNSRFICFSLQFCQFFLHIFWWFTVRHIHNKVYNVFLGNWLLYDKVKCPLGFSGFQVCSFWI